MRCLRIAVAAFALLSAPALWAQDPVVARVGSTVRVTAPSVHPQPMVGILDGANDSHLRLATGAGPIVIPRNAVERLQWSRGLHKPVLKRAVVRQLHRQSQQGGERQQGAGLAPP